MILIADSGATKASWCLLNGSKKKQVATQGLSPYFINELEIVAILKTELLPFLKNAMVTQIFYYGTGCSNANNIAIIKRALKKTFPTAKKITVNHDLMGAARALCGNSKGVACILGTGSNSCVFNGKKIIKNNPAPGFILGDEGSGAYLGKKVLQHFIYHTFDEDLAHRFQLKYNTTYAEILNHVYKEPMPNRYLASFAPFLSENRGHYMVENIVEDGLSDFFFAHLYKYTETWTQPIHFVGSVAFHFKDILKELCHSFELELGTVFKTPMDGLIQYHQANNLKD